MSRKNETLVLEDGYQVGYAIHGDEEGIPVMSIPGHPSSRLDWMIFEKELEERGIQVISVDKPGYGLSGFKKIDCFTEMAPVYGRLATHLGHDRFAMCGLFGGGAFALGACYKLPERITKCVLINTALPPLRDKKTKLGEQMVNAIAHFYFDRIRKNKALFFKKFPSLLQKIFPSEADNRFFSNPELVDFLTEICYEGLRAGLDGFKNEGRLYENTWKFDPSKIPARIPIHMMSGVQDTTFNPELWAEWTRRLPNCTHETFEDEGHLSIFLGHRHEILDIIKGP